MTDYSKTLRRQIQKHLRDITDVSGLEDFLQSVNETYRHSERDRELLERTLDLTSAELTTLNEKIRDEKARALEKLSENEQILKSINENLSEGIFRLNSQGQILFANQAFFRLFGLDASDRWKQTTLIELFADKERWTDLKSRVEINSVLKNEENQMVRSTGERIWVLISMVKVAQSSGSDCYDGSVVDITRQKEIERNLRRANDILANTINIRKKAEEDLRKALEKEKELTELKSRLVSMTSHEFRTPLTTIQTNSEILSIKLRELMGNDQSKIEKHLDRIVGEVVKLTRLMDDILLMGRYESGKIVFQPQEIDLVELASELVHSRKLLNGEDREVLLQIAGTPRPFIGDPTLLSHAITNVVNNALKYSKGCPPPEVSLHFDEEGVVLAVRDFGIGIPEGEKDKLFDTFYRATNVTNIQGTGMGLVIVKQFIELHKGTIRLESEEGKGTVVIINLPYIAPGETDKGTNQQA